MFSFTHSPASSPTLSASSGKPDYPTHGLPLLDGYPSFSPFQGTSEASSSYQAQFVPETWIPETPSSAQPEQHRSDYKLPPHVLEHLDNTQLSDEPELYSDHTRSSQLLIHQMEVMVQGVREERREQDSKMKAQEQLIEKLKEMVYELKDNMEGQEKKLKAQERKLKGHEYRIGKRYYTRSGKK